MPPGKKEERGPDQMETRETVNEPCPRFVSGPFREEKGGQKGKTGRDILTGSGKEKVAPSIVSKREEETRSEGGSERGGL